MKKPIFCILFILFVLYSPINLIGQSKEWKIYNRANVTTSLAEQGNYIWVGTWGGGLSKIDKSTNQLTSFRKENSNIPDMYINCLKTQGANIIWVGTNNGLAKFDGTTWTVYRTSNSQIPDNAINWIDIDAMGGIWVATKNGGAVLNGKVWTVYNTSNSNVPSNMVNFIVLEPTGAKIFGTNNGIGKFDGADWYIFNKSNTTLPDNDITCLSIDITGAKWYGTRNGGMVLNNGSSYVTLDTLTSGIPDNTVNSIAFLAGTIWVGTNKGYASFDNMVWTKFNTSNSILPNNVINHIISNEQTGTLWLATDDSLVKRQGNQITKLDPTIYKIPGNYIRTVYNDNQGFMWVGTDFGLGKFNGDTWVNYTTANSGLKSNTITSVTQDKNKDFWFGTDNGLVFKSGNSWTVFDTSNSPIPSIHVTSLAYDNNNNLWIGTTKGLARLNSSTWTIYNTSNSPLTSDNITSLAIEGNSNVWVGTTDGLGWFDAVTWIVFKTTNSGLPGNMVTSIFIDKQNTKWVSTLGGGIGSFNGSSWVKYNNATTGLPDDFVLSVTKDTSNTIWAGTMVGGLIGYNGSTWNKFNMDNSPLPDNSVYSLITDAGNNIWGGTPGGLFVYRKDSIIPSVYITSVTPTTRCAGNNIQIFYNTLFKFNTGNKFTAEISDRDGSFNPTAIAVGTTTSTTSGVITCLIPSKLQSGFGFRARVSGNNPKNISSNNGTDLTFNELPALSIQGSSSVCFSSNFNYSTTKEVGVTYQWIVTNGTIIGAANSNVVSVRWSNIQTSGKVKLIVTSTAGCSDSLEQNVSIFQHNPKKITGSLNVCANDQYNYKASDDPTIVNFWKVTGGKLLQMPDHNRALVLWGKAGPGRITLIEVSKNGCIDSTTFNVNIFASPDAKFLGTDEVIEGNSSTYTSTPVPPSIRNKWYAVGGKINGKDTSSSVKIDWGTGGLGVVIHVQKNQLGCVDSLISVVRIFDKLKISGILSACENTQEIYSAVSNLDGQNTWTVTGGVIQNNPKERVIKVLWGKAGIGKVKIVQVVPGTIFRDSTTYDVIINPVPPQPTITERLDTLISSADFGNNWYWNGKPLGITTKKCYTGQIKGLYSVQVITAPNCESIMSDPYDFISGVNELTYNVNEVNVFPNPNNGIFSLEINPIYSSNVKYEIINNLGEVLLKRESGLMDSRKIEQIDLSELADGCYYLNINLNDRKYMMKIIIAK